jgi:MOSC domain-containing protein YiiM
MTAKITSVNISDEKGQKKHGVGKCMLVEQHGLADDAHAGKWHRQVSLLAEESMEKIRKAGLVVHAGDFAENLTTLGINLPALPVGSKLKIGADVLMRVTQIGKVCHNRCAIFYSVGDCVMPKEGIFAEVLRGGLVEVGDGIEVLSPGDGGHAGAEAQ